MNKKQQILFKDLSIEEWQEHYIGMPEYNNIKEPEPLITATFKFKNEKDFSNFKDLVQKYIYNGVKVFDGMQRKEKKSAWYPHKEKSSKYEYL